MVAPSTQLRFKFEVDLFPLNGVAVPLGLPVPDGFMPPGGVVIIDPECFTGRAAIERPERNYPALITIAEGLEISVTVLAVACDSAAIIDGAGCFQFPPSDPISPIFPLE